MVNKRLLTPADVKCIEFDPDCSRFECLVRISMVARKIYEEEQLMKETTMEEEKEEANLGMSQLSSPMQREEQYFSNPNPSFITEAEMKKAKIKRQPKSEKKKVLTIEEEPLKKPVVVIDHPVDNLSKEERLKREKRLKRPVTDLEEKPKKNESCESEESEDEEKFKPIKKKKKIQGSNSKGIDNGPDPPPDLPPEFKKKINNLNGSKLMFLIQKRVTATDVSNGHNRLSMPLRRVDADFLSEEEKKHLNSYTEKNVPEIPAKIIQPKSCQECDVTFKKWVMKKERGNTSSVYVFSREWNEIKKNNGIKEGMIVQIWSFRKQDNELCFALVIVVEGGNGNRSSGSQSGVKKTPSTSQSHQQD